MALTDLPIQLQASIGIAEYVNRIVSLRTQLELADAQIQTGTVSVKKAIGIIPETIQTTIISLLRIIENYVIPKDKIPGFDAGTESLFDYADQDTFVFYNDLNRIRFSMNEIISSVGMLAEVPVRPVQVGSQAIDGSGMILDSVTEEEFEESGFASPSTEIEEIFEYYEIRDGDTYQTIAAKKSRNADFNSWVEILAYNDITEAEIADGSAVGKILKIPTGAVVPVQNENNMVFVKQSVNPTQPQLQQFLYGSDFAVINKRLQISGSGDFATVSGIDTILQSAINRVKRFENSLNPIHPEDGLRNAGSYGNVPFIVLLDRVISDIESKLEIDPAIINARLDRKSLVVKGDAFYVDATIQLIGGETTPLGVPVPVGR